MCGCIFKIFAKRQYALIFTPISVINVWISYGARKPVRFDSTDRILEMEEREAIIKKTIEMLPDTTRTIFILCFVEHKKYAEAAEVLHVSLSTIKKHIVRALKLIRESRGGNDESQE